MTKTKPKTKPRSKPKALTMKVAELLKMPAAYNPRTISKAAHQSLRRSLKRFGPVQPIVVNARLGRIVGGHQRARAARDEGLVSFPVQYVDLDETEERQLNLALNSIGGEWDETKLVDVLREIEDAGGDLVETGLEDAELARLLAEDEKTIGAQADEEREQYGAGTNLARSSAPMRHWRAAGFLKRGRLILDFGCGTEEHAFERYDAFLEPDPAPLLKSWDVVLCNYVLNVQPADHLVIQICALISRMLAEDGVALIAVVAESSMSGTAACGHRDAKSRKDWATLLAQVFEVEPAGGSFAGFICRAKGA